MFTKIITLKQHLLHSNFIPRGRLFTYKIAYSSTIPSASITYKQIAKQERKNFESVLVN